MKEDKYFQKSKDVALAIDLAIEAMTNYPPKILSSDSLNHTISVYADYKESALNPEPRYRNLKSLSYISNDILVYFQEAGGKDVDEFWKKIKEHDLPYKRENKLLKILKRKKINNDIEYDFVIDTIVPYQQEGLINDDEVLLLNSFIKDFEDKAKKKR
ncbi:MAG: hypothetical protein QM710_05900 [Flavobacterium sp.]